VKFDLLFMWEWDMQIIYVGLLAGKY
jgi:hypothetical protein